jgi:hemerythrin superfamily protein
MHHVAQRTTSPRTRQRAANSQKSTAKKSAARKSAAKKTAARKTAAKKSTTRRTTTAARQPDAISLLKDDHRHVEELFSRFEGLGDRAQKSKTDIVQQVIEALSAHAAIEEQIFYPAVRRAVRDLEDEVLESLEEHHIVKWTLSELEGMSAQDERFQAKVMVLMESVRHHVREEEKDMFPRVRKALSAAQLQQLGDRLRAAKQLAPSRPHPRSPDTPPGNVVAAAITAPLDAAADLAQSAASRVRDLVT